MPSVRLVRFLYNRLAFAYDATLALGARLGVSHEVPLRHRVFSQLDLPAGTRLLDLGCGTAAGRPFLGSSIHYTGLDLSINMLRRARARLAAGRLLCADIQFPPLRPHHFDVILSMGALQHLPTPRTALPQIRRLLRQPGRILILDERRPLARACGVPVGQLARVCADALGARIQRVESFYEYLLLDLIIQD